jgi:hypothetical protein
LVSISKVANSWVTNPCRTFNKKRLSRFNSPKGFAHSLQLLCSEVKLSCKVSTWLIMFSFAKHHNIISSSLHLE